jgi:ABC-type glutathione transport system ATPase component
MEKGTSVSPLLSVKALTKSFVRGGWLRGRRTEVEALRGVDIDLQAGQTLAILGASGSGKSTLARCIAGIEPPTAGEIWFDGSIQTGKVQRHPIQLIFQDPGASLNPRHTVARALTEPLLLCHATTPDSTLRESLSRVGLPESLAKLRTSQISGGQRARLALARALAAMGPLGNTPKLLILDESLASLDLSTQAQMINLLVDLQVTNRLTYILIAHDLSLATHMADDIAVMFGGKIVERATPNDFLMRPNHQHTRQLLAAALSIPEVD